MGSRSAIGVPALNLLMIGELQDYRLWGVLDEPTPQEVSAKVSEGVDIFLAAYAAEGAAG